MQVLGKQGFILLTDAFVILLVGSRRAETRTSHLFLPLAGLAGRSGGLDYEQVVVLTSTAATTISPEDLLLGHLQLLIAVKITIGGITAERALLTGTICQIVRP